MPRLETAARIAYWPALDYRGVAQLVEYRSPKPGVVGSSPSAPAMSSGQYGVALGGIWC